MKWRTEEIDQYLNAMEYMDTAVVPLVPLAFGKKMKNTVLKGEFPLIISEELERQLKGRIVLFPAFTYLVDEQDESIISRIAALRDELSRNGFPHIALISSDTRWSGVDELKEDVITIPPVPLEHMEEKYKRDIIDEQVKHLLQIVTKKWQNTNIGE